MKWKPTIQADKERLKRASNHKDQKSIMGFTKDSLFMFTKNKQEKEKMTKMTKKEGKEFEPIEEGKHEGFIVDVKLREKPYAYIDIYLSVEEMKKEDGSPLTVKASYPANLVEGSYLDQALLRLEYQVSVGCEFDTDELKGIPVSYQTMNNESDDGKVYANVINKTVKRRPI